ncbi:MAG: glycosyltransferase [Acidimicrobiia bacterium]|nr:glycosyltransferase [Acidimicrobiia bacterium]
MNMVTRDSTLFLVWGPPSHGPRSKVFGRVLGIDVEFVEGSRRRGLLAAPLKYPIQLAKTIRLLRRRRPRLVFVQSPPSFAPLVVWAMASILRMRFVIDAHSDAFQSVYWTRPAWLYRRLARAALATIVTNEHFAEDLRRHGAEALVLRDIPTEFPEGGTYSFPDGFNVAVVSTFADDEPTEEVLATAAALPEVTFHITGDAGRADQGLVGGAAANVRFTGFLRDEDYYQLLRGADAVMCLTTRNHTMQRGACEALSLGRPIITSDWPLLKDYFHEGTVHVDNTAHGIRIGVEDLRINHGRYLDGIRDLKSAQEDEWEMAFSMLSGLIEGEDR